MAKQRNPRVVMREKTMEIQKSINWLKDTLTLPSLFVWRASPDAKMKTWHDHGATSWRAPADVQAWEHIENNPRDLANIIAVSEHVAEQAVALGEMARKRLNELKEG